MTEFTEVYGSFLAITRDWDLNELIDAEKEAQLKEFMIKTIPEFDTCEQDLNDRDDLTDQFNITLTPLEIEILAYYMVHKWSKQFLFNTDNMEMWSTLTPTRMPSLANHINALRALADHSIKEVDRLTNKYEYGEDFWAQMG